MRKMIKNLTELFDRYPFHRSTSKFQVFVERDHLFWKLVQSRAIHPDWTLEAAVVHEVNDEFVDPRDVVTAVRGDRRDLEMLWSHAGVEAEKRRRDALEGWD